MPTNLTRYQLPPPSNWQDFEEICCDLWRRIWNDPNTARHGRSGQPQHGVDVYGRPNQRDKYAGIQCKGKDNFADKHITAKEVRAEAEKARSFEPPIYDFLLATSGPKDSDAEAEARRITEENLREGRFSVVVLGWPDILARLGDHDDVARKHFSDFYITSQSPATVVEELRETTSEILRKQSELEELSRPPYPATITPHPSVSDDGRSQQSPEFDAAVDEARDLIQIHNPKQALGHLERLKQRAWARGDNVVKFRILTNMGAAKLALQVHEEAARLFLEARQYDENNEKAKLNAALGHLILGDTKSARELCESVLERNPGSTRGGIPEKCT